MHTLHVGCRFLAPVWLVQEMEYRVELFGKCVSVTSGVWRLDHAADERALAAQAHGFVL